MSSVTLGSARRMHCWLWLVCGSTACQRARPVALVPFIIRWGPDTPIDRLRRSAVCSACGHRGALTYTPSWGGSVVGWAPFPVRYGAEDHHGPSLRP